MDQSRHEANRTSWNHATREHNAHKRDQAGFLRAGGTTLYPEEIDLLGPIAGKRLVHLMCNSGQDTLSLAALGADVLGVDITGGLVPAPGRRFVPPDGTPPFPLMYGLVASREAGP